MSSAAKKLVIVTGLSGSGKSIALHSLEDCNFYCIDNLPTCLLEPFIRELVKNPRANYQQTAVGMDSRNLGGDLSAVPARLAELRAHGFETEVLFLEADNDSLIRRFSESRRPHPLAKGRPSLTAAIEEERQLLEPLLSHADLRIDTSRSTVHELRRLISERVAVRNAGTLSLMVHSFGFKHGLPKQADFVFDARCLPNPHWQPELRPLTGRDAAVADFLQADSRVETMTAQIIAFLEQWIPCFEAEGRSYLTVAIGCTGGQHRSVYLTEKICRHFNDRQRPVFCDHRELNA